MFNNFISLGAECSVAASMSKYGLRSWSGPFDWLITESLAGVLHFIETDFKDFLERKNLEIYQDSSIKFMDKKNKVHFVHDTDYSIEENYEELYVKYQNKIERFAKEIQKKTCFIRLISSYKELVYVEEHEKYIRRIVTKGNKHNEIVFLLKEPWNVNKIKFRYFILHGCKDEGGARKCLRSRFDSNDEFIAWCILNADIYKVIKNLRFDEENEEKYERIFSLRYGLLNKLFNFDFDSIFMPYDLIIYGAGNIGMNFYTKVKNKFTIRCFVDQAKCGKIDHVPIIRLDKLKNVENCCFVVTATYDFENIYNRIRRYFPNVMIKSLDEILQYK